MKMSFDLFWTLFCGKVTCLNHNPDLHPDLLEFKFSMPLHNIMHLWKQENLLKHESAQSRHAYYYAVGILIILMWIVIITKYFISTTISLYLNQLSSGQCSSPSDSLISSQLRALVIYRIPEIQGSLICVVNHSYIYIHDNQSNLHCYL